MIETFINSGLLGKFDLNLCTRIEEFAQSIYDLNVSTIATNGQILLAEVDDVKKIAVACKNEKLANSTYVVRAFIDFILYYYEYLKNIKNADYQKSWNTLQNCIDTLNILNKYEKNKDYFVLNDYMLKIEKLYPYKVFNSIEMKITEEVCSICGASMLKDECDHIRGELYWGERAYGIVHDGALVCVSLVSNPKDKRCVVEIPDTTEKYLQKNLEYVKKLLTIPFNGFDIKPDEFNVHHLIITPYEYQYRIAFFIKND